MLLNRNVPTLTGVQTGAYDALTTSSLAVSGNCVIGGIANMTSLSGACITDSLTTPSSTRCASAAAVAALNTNMGAFLPLVGGNVSGDLVVGGSLACSNLTVLGGLNTVYAYETNSSNVVIDNKGTGPALKVTQVEGGPLGAQPVCEFYNCRLITQRVIVRSLM